MPTVIEVVCVKHFTGRLILWCGKHFHNNRVLWFSPLWTNLPRPLPCSSLWSAFKFILTLGPNLPRRGCASVCADINNVSKEESIINEIVHGKYGKETSSGKSPPHLNLTIWRCPAFAPQRYAFWRKRSYLLPGDSFAVETTSVLPSVGSLYF